MLCEIGGTVGDIEGLPFFEAIRQFSQERPRGQCIFMHLTLLPYLAASGELKTKPTQHSVKELQLHRPRARRAGLPLASMPIPREGAREDRAVLQRAAGGGDRRLRPASRSTRRRSPTTREGLDQAVLDAFGISPGAAARTSRSGSDVVDRHPQRRGRGAGRDRRQVHPARGRLQVDRRGADPRRHGQPGQGAGRVGRRRALRARGPGAATSRASTPSWCPAASASAAPRARSRRRSSRASSKVPYLGICLGMQMAVIEASRNLPGSTNAGSEEFDHEAGREALHAGRLPPQGMGAGQPHGRAQGRRRQGRHHAARRLHGDPDAGPPGGRTSTARPRSRSGTATATRWTSPTASKLEDVRAAASPGMSPDGRLPEIVEMEGPSLVHRRAVPPGAEVEALRAAPAVRGLRQRGGGAVAAGLSRPCRRDRDPGRMAARAPPC